MAQIEDSQSAYQALDRFSNAFAHGARRTMSKRPMTRLIVENALNGMISSLDPHSSYFDPKTYADMQVKTEGQYGGVGLVIAADNGTIKIVSPMDDTPASRAGIKSGDIILAVDGKGLQGLSLDKVQELLRGARGHQCHADLDACAATIKSFEVKLDARGDRSRGREIASRRRCRLYPHSRIQRAHRAKASKQRCARSRSRSVPS